MIIFFVGRFIKANIDGRLNIVENKKHSITSMFLDKIDCQFIKTSEMHQKLGTLSWYKPRWIGNIAVATD